MHTRTLLVASLSLLATSAIAQTQYAWVGTYNPNGEGLYRFTVDPQTGALNDKTLVSKLPNAAQLTVSHDGKTLYLASEVEQGVVQALRIGDNGALSELNQVSSGGAGPVYLSLTPNGKHCWWQTTSAELSQCCPLTQTAAWAMLRTPIRTKANRARRSRKLPSRAVSPSAIITAHMRT